MECTQAGGSLEQAIMVTATMTFSDVVKQQDKMDSLLVKLDHAVNEGRTSALLSLLRNPGDLE